MKSKLIILFISIITLWSCSKDEENQATLRTGIVKGKVTTVNTHKPVGGALVFTFDNKNEIHYTYSNVSGEFTLNVPIGNRKLYIQTGDGSNFRVQTMIDVQYNQTLVLDEANLRLDQVANIAYVSGSYDSIEDIVTDLGYQINEITFNDLNDYSIVSQYDVIFLNCGSISSSISASPTVTSNLAKFVTNGGSLYASDWAVAYLIGGNSNSTACSPAGGFISDSTLCSVNNGSTGVLSASITNTALADAIGLTTLDINYDLGSWQRINSVDETFWEVLVRNSANNEALMIKTNNFFDSSLVDSSVGNSNDPNWITICHNSDNPTPITITIEASEWPLHEAHGDTLGSCESIGSNGTIYYTTFHNHANGNIGNSQLILEQLILNL